MKKLFLSVWLIVANVTVASDSSSIEDMLLREKIVQDYHEKDISFRMKHFMRRHPLLAKGIAVATTAAMIIGLDYAFNEGKGMHWLVDRTRTLYDRMFIIHYEEAIEKIMLHKNLTVDECTILSSIKNLDDHSGRILYWVNDEKPILTQEQFDTHQDKDFFMALADTGLIAIQPVADDTIVLNSVDRVAEIIHKYIFHNNYREQNRITVFVKSLLGQVI